MSVEIEVYAEKVKETAVSALALVERTEVTNEATYAFVAEQRALAGTFIKEAKAKMKPIITKAHEAHKAALALEKELCALPEQVINACDSKLIPYREAQEAAKRALIEEEQRKAREAQERALAEAQKAMAAGDTEAVEAAKQAIVAAEAPLTLAAALDSTPKVAGVSYRTVSEVVVVTPSLVPDEYWELNMVKIREDALNGVVIPGIEVRKKTVAVNR
jgi:hypothetical protein